MGGAVEKIWFALGKEFVRRGHEVVHVSRLCGGLPREEVIEGVQHLRVPGFDSPASLALLKGYDLIYSWRALRVLPKADILVTNTFWLPMLVRSARYGKLYVHAARYPKGQMRFYAHADRLQTVSSPIQSAIVREVPQLAAKVKAISNPLPGEVPATIPERAKLPGGEKRLLYVGRVHPEKGIQLLLDAFALLPQAEFGNWKLVVVGPAESKFGGGGMDYLAQLKQRVENLGERVIWMGAIFDNEALDEHYRAASLFVYPSLAEKGETFGLAPLEAMAQGCPALVSNLECFGDFIEEAATGFVFDHRATDPVQALAEKLKGLMRDETRLAATAIRAHRKAGEFSLGRIAGQYLEDFQSLLAT